MNRRHFVTSTVAAAVALSFHQKFALAAVSAEGGSVEADINAVTLDGAQATLSKASVQELADSLRGNLLLPGSEAYDAARLLLNPKYNKFPALVVQPKGAADVETAVQFASQEKLLTAVKCGGHAFAGTSTCDGGMQIDLSMLRFARVDPVAQRAWIGGGSLLAELDFEAMAHGLVTTAGSVSHTGVGGLTLGGGFGRLARKFGLSIDNVKSVDIVTADGQLRRASAEENPDLYWAARGGGGNFGVATAFEFQLHPMSREVIAGRYMFPFEKRREMLKFAAEYAASAPDELLVGPFVGAFPGDSNVAVIGVVYCGDPSKAEELFAPIEKAGAVENTVKTWDYVALQKSGDLDDPRANGAYMKAGFVESISDDLVDDLVDTFEAHPARSTWMAFGHGGGAIARVPSDATAFASRNAGHNLLSFVGWPVEQDGAQHVDYIKRQWEVMKPYTDGFYVNDLSDETPEMIAATYAGNWSRLVEIKNKYDPANLFRLNANIPPSA